MGKHVYNHFWALHCVKVLQINFNKRNQQFEKVPKWQKIILSPAILSAILFFYIDTVYYLVTKSLFTDIEFIYTFELPFLLICVMYYHWFMYRCSPKIVSFLENLQSLNEVLSKSLNVRRRNWLVQGAILLMNWIMIALLMLWPMEIYFHYAKPELKVFTLQAILIPFPLHAVFCLLISAYLLLDQTSILNEIIIRIANKQHMTVAENHCVLCKRNMTNAHLLKLCQLHHLRYLIGIYTTIVNLCHELNRISNLTMTPVLVAVILQSPACLIVVVSSVFLSTFVGQTAKKFFAYTLTVMCIIICYCGVLVFDLLIAEIEKVAKNIHKVYLMLPSKRQFNSTTFAFSVYFLGTKPKFELGYIYELNCHSLMIILNSLILMTVLIMHSL